MKTNHILLVLALSLLLPRLAAVTSPSFYAPATLPASCANNAAAAQALQQWQTDAAAFRAWSASNLQMDGVCKDTDPCTAPVANLIVKGSLQDGNGICQNPAWKCVTQSQYDAAMAKKDQCVAKENQTAQSACGKQKETSRDQISADRKKLIALCPAAGNISTWVLMGPTTPSATSSNAVATQTGSSGSAADMGPCAQAAQLSARIKNKEKAAKLSPAVAAAMNTALANSQAACDQAKKVQAALQQNDGATQAGSSGSASQAVGTASSAPAQPPANTDARPVPLLR